MELIKNRQLNRELFVFLWKKDKVKLSDIKFIMDRFFHFAIPAMMNGYPISAAKELNFKLASILYNDIPARLRKRFTYSSKIFGYTFLPVCDSVNMKNKGYNYRPNKRILKQIAEFTDTDAIYTLTKRK